MVLAEHSRDAHDGPLRFPSIMPALIFEAPWHEPGRQEASTNRIAAVASYRSGETVMLRLEGR